MTCLIYHTLLKSKYLVFILQHRKHSSKGKGPTNTDFRSIRNLNVAVVTTLGFINMHYSLSFDAINVKVWLVVKVNNRNTRKRCGIVKVYDKITRETST